ncbi:MAG: hypothetical protein Kapaf2KO_18210 [Candidatus Kapaibacteriales bacterium]
MKTYTLDEAEDQLIGKKSMKERDQYEFELRLELIADMIKLARKKKIYPRINDFIIFRFKSQYNSPMKTLLLIFVSVFSFIAFSQTREEKAERINDIERVSEQLAQEQLEAYNSRDIDAFLVPFSDSVEVYTFPDKLIYKGKDIMRKAYEGKFAELVNLHCKITSRIVFGNTVIDSEEVTGILPDEIVEAIAIYTIENNKIQKVHFLRKP